MDEDQITALAREYAEEENPISDYNEHNMFYRNIALGVDREKAEQVITWLLRRFCLVEKSKVEEEYKSAKHDSKMAHREKLYTMLAVASARKALLESLFPEIGKEVEG